MATMVLIGLKYKIYELYIDDCNIFGEKNIEFVFRLKWVFERFRKHNLYLKASKCFFGYSEIEFVHKLTTAEELKMSSKKTQSVLDFPSLTVGKQLKRFLGTVNYLGDFIRNHSVIVKPLHIKLQKKNSKDGMNSGNRSSFSWNDLATLRASDYALYKWYCTDNIAYWCIWLWRSWWSGTTGCFCIRRIMTILIPAATALSTANYLIQHFGYVSEPHQLRSDNCPYFIADDIKEFLASVGTSHCFSKAFAFDSAVIDPEDIAVIIWNT